MFSSKLLRAIEDTCRMPLYLLSAGRVKRYHNMDVPRLQDLAQHQWGVAIILYSCMGEECSKQLLLAALLHDVGEKEYGDMPTTAKIFLPEVKALLNAAEHNVCKHIGLNWDDLNEGDQINLKAADLLETLAWLSHEIKMGCMTEDIMQGFDETRKKFATMNGVHPSLQQFYKQNFA